MHDRSPRPSGPEGYPPPMPPEPWVGRAAALQAVVDALAAGRRAVITGVDARPGLGRSSLAAALCLRRADDLPGLPVWLPGHMADPRLLLARLCAAVGEDVPPARPGALGGDLERLLGQHRLLLVIEDAEAELLKWVPPWTPVVATVRDPAAAVDLDGERIELGPFTASESRALGQALLGATPGGSLADFGWRLAEALQHHPHSVVMALLLLRSLGPDHAGAFFLAVQTRLRKLAAFSEDRRGFAAVFSLLSDHLGEEGRSLLRALALLPSDGFSTGAAAVALGLPEVDAARHLRRLSGLAVVRAQAAGRWRLPPVVGDLARGLGGGPDRQDAVNGWYLERCRADADRPALLDLEMEAYGRVLARAMETGRGDLVTRLALQLAPHLDARGYAREVPTWLHWALASTQRLGSTREEGQVRRWIARFHLFRGGEGRDAAAEHLRQAAALLRSDGARDEAALALEQLAEVEALRGRRREALEVLRQLLSLAGSPGSGAAETTRRARLLLRRGQLLAQVGEDAPAREELQRALALAQQGDDPDDLRAEIEESLGVVSARLSLVEAFEAPLEPPAETPDSDEDTPWDATPADLGPSPAFDAALTGGLALLGAADDLGAEVADFAGEVERLRGAIQDAAERGDRHAEALHRDALGRALFTRGEVAAGLAELEAAVDARLDVGEPGAAARGLEVLGALSTLAGELDDAVHHLLRGLDLREGLEDPAGQATCLLHLARAFGARGEVETASAHLDVAERLYERAREVGGLAAARLTRGALCLQEGRLDDAATWLQRGLDLARELAQPPLVADAQHHLGALAAQRGDTRAALVHLREAVFLRAEAGDVPRVVESLLAVGDVYRRRGDTRGARAFHRRVGELARRLGLEPVASAAEEALGRLALEAGRWEEAETRLGRALTRRRARGDTGGAAELMILLGEAAAGRGALAAAEAWFLRGQQAAELAQASDLVGMALWRRSLLEARRGDIDGARRLLEAGFTLERGGGEPRAAASYLVLLGQLARSEGRLDLARDRWSEAVFLLKDQDPAASEILARSLEHLPA